MNFRKLLRSDLTLRSRIYLAAALTVGSVALYFAQALVAQQEVNSVTREILDRRIVAMQQADRIKQTLLRDEISVFHYLATQNKDQMVKEEQLGQRALDEIRALQSLPQSAESLGLLVQLDSETRRYFSDAREAVAKASSSAPGGLGSHRQLDILSAESEMRLARANALCDRIIAINQREIEEARAQMRGTLKGGRRHALWTAFLLGLVLLLVAVGHSRSILQPLDVLMQGVRRVDEGDLDFQIPVNRSDEIGLLTNSFNTMTRKVAQRRRELRRESITDGLTGLYNQRHFRTLLQQEMERAQRANGRFSLLMIDIDHFKKYNDAMGHESGNNVIRAVADALRGSLRKIDFLARYGGDEMAAILPDTSPYQAKVLAQRMRAAVGESHFPGEESMPASRLTLSIGGATFPQDAASAAEFIEVADRALYLAKRAGRSCLRWASDVIHVQAAS